MDESPKTLVQRHLSEVLQRIKFDDKGVAERKVF